MLKNLIVLPDGTEIFSGVSSGNAIQSATITECVNSGTELTLGSVCASMLEMKFITPGGSLTIAAGEELTLYKVDEEGIRHKVGIFIAEKPTRPSANTYQLTAYDRVSKLDKDVSVWLAGLEGWPYRVDDFARMVCEECGLTLVTTELPNGDYEIQKFSGSDITGRRLMGWVGEVCARFCRANADGDIVLEWYTPSNKCITPDGELFFYQNSLSYEDYEVAEIDKVQLRLTEDDIGAVYPDSEEAGNLYAITGNYLLTTGSTEALEPAAQVIYEQLKDVRYTPCTLDIPANTDIHAGDIVEITDGNGISFTAYVMTKTQTGQRETLECTGSASRDSSTATNTETLKALSGKMMELRKNVEKLSVKATDIQTGMEKNAEAVQTQNAEISVLADSIYAELSKQVQELGTVRENIASVKTTADEVAIQVKSIQNDGVSSVKTTMGYTFNDLGLTIAKEGDEIASHLGNEGLTVNRSNDVMLKADANGVIATDVTVNNYLIIGHSRFEEYSDGTDDQRTGLFWIGG